jgi:hypothetical protein
MTYVPINEHISGCTMWHHQGGDYDRDCPACMTLAANDASLQRRREIVVSEPAPSTEVMRQATEIEPLPKDDIAVVSKAIKESIPPIKIPMPLTPPNEAFDGIEVSAGYGALTDPLIDFARWLLNDVHQDSDYVEMVATYRRERGL